MDTAGWTPGMPVQGSGISPWNDPTFHVAGSGSAAGDEPGELLLPLSIWDLNNALDASEYYHVNTIVSDLNDGAGGRHREWCDRIFGRYTGLVMQYRNVGIAIRAARLSENLIIPHVLRLERQSGRQFHKGALFYDTGLAYYLAGDTDRCSYYIALADEEDVLTGRTEGAAVTHGELNRLHGRLSRQLALPTSTYFIAFLNDSLIDAAGPGGFISVFGCTLEPTAFDVWRGSLDATHHFELFRILHELEVFDHQHSWTYDPALNNPYLLLRLAKVLAHVAQWFESYLTILRGSAAISESLVAKLRDAKFGPYAAAAGSTDQFAGTQPHGAYVDIELRDLLQGVSAASDVIGRRWRMFRIAYIVRNATAHRIDESLGFYHDRTFVRQLIQQVFLASLALREVFAGHFP